MNVTVIAETSNFRLTSYGNGIAYALDHLSDPKYAEHVFVQGDDAEAFWEEYEAARECPLFPDDEHVLAELWFRYH